MSYTAPPQGFRTFLIVWGSQSLSVFGSNLSLFAINVWLVQTLYPRPEQQADLAWALAAMGLTFALPAVLTVPLAGALVDRLDRKRLMLVTDLFSGALMFLGAHLMGTGRLELWMVLTISVLLSLSGNLHGSAFDASYAMLVSDEQLPRANGMMQTMWSLSAVLSPALAAFLISLPSLARQGLVPGAAGWVLAPLSDGSALALTIDAITFLAAAAVLPFLFIPSPKRQDLGTDGAPKSSIWADVREGALYIWRRRPMLWLLGTFAVFNLCFQNGIFTPLLVKVELAADWGARGYTFETALAAINTTMALGGLVGGVAISAWGGLKQRRVLGVIVPLVVAGAGFVGLGLSDALHTAVGITFVLALQFPLANSHSQAIWQSLTPREMQGRVFSVRRVIAQFTGPLGQVAAGWLAARFAPGVGMVLLGSIITVVCVAQLFNRSLMRIDEKGFVEQYAARSA